MIDQMVFIDFETPFFPTAGRYWSNGMDLRFLDTCSTEEMSTLQRDTNQLMARTVDISPKVSLLKQATFHVGM